MPHELARMCRECVSVNSPEYENMSADPLVDFFGYAVTAKPFTIGTSHGFVQRTIVPFDRSRSIYQLLPIQQAGNPCLVIDRYDDSILINPGVTRVREVSERDPVGIASGFSQKNQIIHATHALEVLRQYFSELIDTYELHDVTLFLQQLEFDTFTRMQLGRRLVGHPQNPVALVLHHQDPRNGQLHDLFAIPILQIQAPPHKIWHMFNPRISAFLAGSK